MRGFGEGHDADYVGDSGRDVEEVFGPDPACDGPDERVELREVHHEVVGAVLAEVLECLRGRGPDLLVRVVEAGRDVGELEGDVVRVEVDPLRVAADDEDRGVPDLGVRRELRHKVHDERHDLVVGRVDLGAHRAHREQRRLEVLPLDLGCRRRRERGGDDVVRPSEARRRAEDGTAVLEGVADRVAEVAEVVALLAGEGGVVVRVVEVADDGADEVGEDGEEGTDGGVVADLAHGAREAVPEVEGDACDAEVVVGGANRDQLDEGEEGFEVGDDEAIVPLAGFNEDAAVPSHLVRVGARRGVEQVRPEGGESRDELLDDAHVLLDFLSLVDEVDESVDCSVKELVGREGREEGREDGSSADRGSGSLAGLEPSSEAGKALILERGCYP